MFSSICSLSDRKIILVELKYHISLKNAYNLALDKEKGNTWNIQIIMLYFPAFFTSSYSSVVAVVFLQDINKQNKKFNCVYSFWCCAT